MDNTESSAWCSVTTYRGGIGGGRGKKEAQEEGNICMLMANSCYCTTETNTVLLSHYPPIEKNF